MSVKYGKKLLGKLQRAPAAAAALAAATAAASEVLAPGFEESCAAAEAAERRANPAAALPDDLFSDEPPAAARQPSAAERRTSDAEVVLEAALTEARSLRAFLQEASLEQAEAALAALQHRRQHRERQQAAAAAALAAATAAPQRHLLASPAGLLPANGHLSELPLLQHPPAPPEQQAAAAAAALAAATAAHDGLGPDNECVICMASVRQAWVACVCISSPHLLCCVDPTGARRWHAASNARAAAASSLLTLRPMSCSCSCRRVLCVPCGHMCLCSRCLPLAQADGKCPMCRLPLQDLVQLF